ncbi:MAG: hypothetical protein ACLF0P_04960 [Thermoanaerobaculia bacterium]
MDDETAERLLGELAETRRHFDVVAEDLRGEVRLVAEGVAGVDSGLRDLRSEIEYESFAARVLLGTV